MIEGMGFNARISVNFIQKKSMVLSFELSDELQEVAGITSQKPLI